MNIKLITLEQVSSCIGYLFCQYQPYMWWVLLATAGVWNIVMGVFFAIAQKNEDKEKARKMIKNYVIGLVRILLKLYTKTKLMIIALRFALCHTG